MMNDNHCIPIYPDTYNMYNGTTKKLPYAVSMVPARVNMVKAAYPHDPYRAI